MSDRQEGRAPKLGQTHNALFSLVYDAIKQGIIEGRYKAGDRLVEDRLAEEYGVSRNPIREAIRLLSSEGLVEVTRRRGVYVAFADPHVASEVVEIRAVLEGHNARLAARRNNPALLEKAQEILSAGQKALGKGEIAELRGLNEAFHKELAAAGENELLSDILAMLRVRSALLFAKAAPEFQKQSWEEHAQILQAILDGDEENASALATSHVLQAGSRAREVEDADRLDAPEISTGK